jgi:hypothetical protein
MRLIACVVLAATLTAGCSKRLPEPVYKLPERPAAYTDLPQGLDSDERKLCEMASKRKLQGLLTKVPSLCRKVEYNFIGWTYLRAFVRSLYNSLFNRDGSKDGWFS